MNFFAMSLFLVLLMLIGTGIFIILELYSALPSLVRDVELPALQSSVTIKTDQHGIPTIIADSRLDAFRALGYVTARDRLFQMDLLRRKASGRLSEILGTVSISADIERRMLGFNRLSETILGNLPKDQQELLKAYTDGVNAIVDRVKIFPLEYLALGCRPERWTEKDIILVVLGIFQDLTGSSEEQERMLSVMTETLPPELVAFLTPDDERPTPLIGGSDSHRPRQPIPVKAIYSLLQNRPPNRFSTKDFINLLSVSSGSNCWVVGKSKTVDGRVILANDLHTELAVPNLLYRAVLRYQDVELSGAVVPGIPAVIIGSNGRVAWGFTNTQADVLDLVKLEINPENEDEYRTPSGWAKFEISQEKIRVRGGRDIIVDARSTLWGPVSPIPLMNQPVAIHWTALDPAAVDLGLINMDCASSIEEAVKVMQNFKGPPLNVFIADATGRIAWTYSGKVPIRRGFDGSFSLPWANDDIGWEGYIPADNLPSVVDPPSGFLVNANNRTVGKDFPYMIGGNFTSGHRADQIHSYLETCSDATELDMFELQLDTTSSFYRFYQLLILELLTDAVIHTKSDFLEARTAIENWDGRVDLNSLGIGLLVRFRDNLARDIFQEYLDVCKQRDETFVFNWRNIETPLRMILKERIPDTLPDPSTHKNWESFLLEKLEMSIHQLKSEFKVTRLSSLYWGRINLARISHPLARMLPLLQRFLNMPQDPLPGCPFSIRVSAFKHGAYVRMVISPGHHEAGILHMPCGQSGNAFSRNYRDQHRFWVRGESLPFQPSATSHILVLQAIRQSSTS